MLSIHNYFINLHAFPLFIVGTLILFSGVFVCISLKGKNSGIAFFLMSISGGVWFLGTAMGYLSKNPEIALLWFKIDNVGVVFLSSTVYSFIVSFLRIAEKRKAQISAAYIGSILFSTLILTTNWMETGVHEYFWGYFPMWGFLSYMFLPFFYSYMIYSFIEILFYYLNGKDQKVKNQLLLFLIAFGIAYTSSIDYFATFGISIYPTSFLSMGIYFMVIAYAITKHELMDIRVVITRAAAYGLVGGLLIASFIGLNSFALPQAAAMAANALLALFWALAAHRLRAFIQTPLEEKWITDWYDSDKLINHIATRLIPVLAKEEAFKIIAEELKSAIKIKNIEIRSGQQEIDLKDITQTKTGLIIPLSSSEGLEGALILGQKTSEDSYNEKDLTIFRTIMVQAMAIFDRIRPYEKIKKDFEANQKKLYDTERLLARSERIASLANTIREYNHEIKTPLSIIRGEAALLVKEPRDPKYLEWFKSLVYEQVDRANDIVESTLRLSTPKERKEISLNLNDVMDGALKLFPLTGVHLEKELGALPPVSGDPEDLQLVFINLFKNAVEAMPDGGTLRLKSYWQKTGEESFAVAEIADTGAGIPPENLDRIFEPFFSSHVTKGRGLGLSIVFRVIREHLGSIEVKSEVGKGSAFIVKIPVKT